MRGVATRIASADSPTQRSVKKSAPSRAGHDRARACPRHSESLGNEPQAGRQHRGAEHLRPWSECGQQADGDVDVQEDEKESHR
jgi:hypothetical protein